MAIKRFLFLLLLIASLFLVQAVCAEDGGADIYFFYGEGCPHCAKEEEFLDELTAKNEKIKVISYEVWRNQENAQFLSELDKKLGLKVSGVPVTIIGETVVAGYYNDEITGSKIESAVSECVNYGCADIVAESAEKKNTGGAEEETEISGKILLPIIGEVDPGKISLPFLTILIAALDGFNPCAMWVLLFLISLLLGIKDRKKMWILGGAFLVSSAAVYFLFLSAWLNLFLFLGVIAWMRMAIGGVALASGGYNLREWWTNREGVCKVTSGEKRKAVFEKLRKIILENKFWLALGGIIVLAAAVNLVELICSAGLPAVYTQVLTMSDLPRWKYYSYLLLYVFIFLLDDLLVFAIAMTTLQTKMITAKYSRYSGLVGGLVMLIIGLLLIFKPAWIMFG